MFATVQKMLKDESGATAIEYGLIAAVIGAGLVASLPVLSSALSDLWDDIATGLETAGGGIATAPADGGASGSGTP